MIENLKVQHYKSLKSVDIPFHPLTALIGPNASGKSNILDAMAFISEFVRGENITNMISRRGGYGSCVWGGDRSLHITFEAEGHLSDQEGEARKPFIYGVQLYSVDNLNKISSERIDFAGKNILRRTEAQWNIPTAIPGPRMDFADPLTSAVPGTAGQSKPIQFVYDNIRNWKFYQFDTNAMREPQPIRKQYQLEKSGRNLSTVLHALYSESHPAWDEISEILKVFLPRVKKLLSPIDDSGGTYAAILEEGLPNHISTRAMSDGTLFALALATALSVPHAPGLLAFEAPDTEIHPYLLEHIAELLISASERTQIVVTTHSPYLVKHLPAESIVIVEHRGGETKVKAVSNDNTIMEAIKSLGPAEAWYSGHIGGVP